MEPCRLWVARGEKYTPSLCISIFCLPCSFFRIFFYRGNITIIIFLGFVRFKGKNDFKHTVTYITPPFLFNCLELFLITVFRNAYNKPVRARRPLKGDRRP